MNGLRIRAAEELILAPGNEVLDLGCGDGWFSLLNGMVHPEVRFTGIDLYEAEEAREISKLMGITNCRFYSKNALAIDFNKKFDFIVLFMALGNICETSSSVRRLFTNCRKLMRESAKFLIVEPFEEDFPEETRRTLLQIYQRYKSARKSSGEDHETILRRDRTLQILEDARFGILETRFEKLRWYMRKEEVMRYFGFESLRIEIPDRFWVFDKPSQVTVVLAKKYS
jgi:SAM-dependent methyltransferase